MGNRTTFEFRTKEQVKKFVKELRARFILTHNLGEKVVEIFQFDKIKEEHRASVLVAANKVYSQIINK